MLVIKVRNESRVYVGDAEIIVSKAGKHHVRLAIKAPRDVRVRRERKAA